MKKALCAIASIYLIVGCNTPNKELTKVHVECGGVLGIKTSGNSSKVDIINDNGLFTGWVKGTPEVFEVCLENPERLPEP